MKQPWTTLSALCYIQQLNKLCGGLLHDYRILKRSVTDHRPVNLNTIFLAFLIFWLRFGVELLCPARKREIVHVYPIFSNHKTKARVRVSGRDGVRVRGTWKDNTIHLVCHHWLLVFSVTFMFCFLLN